jgi:diaminohydroxyphosphoribosylaminopyrimidine deaminase/5-amino-6-(5-phosphoribosylamino)uracil reductase
VLRDNPFLTTRLDDGKGNDAVRVVVDSKGLLPLECNLINVDSQKGVILATTPSIDSEKEKQLEDKGVKIIKAGDSDGKVDLNKLMDELYKLEIDSVLLEGGGGLNASALKYGIVDKVMFFIAP